MNTVTNHWYKPTLATWFGLVLIIMGGIVVYINHKNDPQKQEHEQRNSTRKY